MNIGQRIKTCLEEAGKTQKSLAKGAELAESTLSDIIKGKKEPSITKAAAIAHYLEVDLEWLVSGQPVARAEGSGRVAENSDNRYGLSPWQQKTLNELMALVGSLDDAGCRMLIDFGRRLQESLPARDEEGE